MLRCAVKAVVIPSPDTKLKEYHVSPQCSALNGASNRGKGNAVALVFAHPKSVQVYKTFRDASTWIRGFIKPLLEEVIGMPVLFKAVKISSTPAYGAF